MEFVTKEDLQLFRMQLLDDLKKMLDTELQKREIKPEWIKSREARKILKASPGTLQNLRVAGTLNPEKIGGTWYYSLREIELLFEKK